MIGGKGWGQAKSVERAFGVGGLGEYIDKHPALAGVFAGENVSTKPENYGSRAVNVDTFLENVIQFASGYKIKALSSNPSNLRGMQGNVIIDEAAFQADRAAVLKAALALTMWGNNVRLNLHPQWH